MAVAIVTVGLVGAVVGCASDDDGSAGRLIVQNSGDAMEAFFGGTVLAIDADGCTTTGDATVIWPLGTTWASDTRSVRLVDGTELFDGTVFDTGGGWVTLTDDEIRSFDDWIDQSTVTDDTLACGASDDYLVIGAFESVVDD